MVSKVANQVFTIGKLARLASVNVETIRYYQRRGILLMPKKPPGSVRHYSDSDVSRVQFTKSAQRLGFTLEEILLLLKLEDGTHCDDAREIAVQKLANVQMKLADLKNIEMVLSGFVKNAI